MGESPPGKKACQSFIGPAAEITITYPCLRPCAHGQVHLSRGIVGLVESEPKHMVRGPKTSSVRFRAICNCSRTRVSSLLGRVKTHGTRRVKCDEISSRLATSNVGLACSRVGLRIRRYYDGPCVSPPSYPRKLYVTQSVLACVYAVTAIVSEWPAAVD
jgi:hypothetical protein